MEPISWECARKYNGKWPTEKLFLYRMYANTYTTDPKVGGNKAILRSVSREEFRAACERLGIKFKQNNKKTR